MGFASSLLARSWAVSHRLAGAQHLVSELEQFLGDEEDPTAAGQASRRASDDDVTDFSSLMTTCNALRCTMCSGVIMERSKLFGDDDQRTVYRGSAIEACDLWRFGCS